MITIRLPSVRFVAVAMSVIVLTSCSLVNPHVKWETPKDSAGQVIPASKFKLDDGIQYAENAKAAYKDAIGNQSYLTSWLGIGLIPVAATALGLGMTGHSPTAVTVLGLTAASGYAVGTLLYSKPNQQAWVAGYNATTCAVDAISPLLYVEKNKDEIIKKKNELYTAMASVSNQIGTVRSLLKSIPEKPSGVLVEPKKLAEQRIAEGEKLLTDARETRRAAEKMLLDTETGGETLKQTVDRISGKVSQQIVENAPDIQALSTLIGGLAQSYGQFVTIPEGLRPAPSRGGQAISRERTDPDIPKAESLQTATNTLEKEMLNLQNAISFLAEIVNAVTASKPIDTLKACGVTIEQIAQPLTVEPSGRIEMQYGKAATIGRVIRGGSAPYAVTLQGDNDGPVVRQTEPFGPAFTVQTTNTTPAKEYSIYVSDKAGQKLFLIVDVKSELGGPGPSSGQAATPVSQAVNLLNEQKPTFPLTNPDATVTVINAADVAGSLQVGVQIKAKTGQTEPDFLDQIDDKKIAGEIAGKYLKNLGIKSDAIKIEKK